MSEMEEHLNDEFPKVERTEVEFNKKESLKQYIVSDEDIRAHFQDEIKAIHFSSESKSKLKKETCLSNSSLNMETCLGK
jgi:hypothetical protein